MNYTILEGDNRDTLKTLEDNSIDAIVTDPPYGIDFLGKAWDANTGALETYQECLRVLKPGGHILAFSAARTYHHLAVTLEQAGFEIRDQIMWLYASGFPKAQDLGKAIERREGKRVSATADNNGNTYAIGMNSVCHKCNMPHGTATRGMCKKEDCPINEALKPADNKWAGWKTALKPAHEPICMARKPFKGSTIDNVLEHGVGALNIDATRIDYEDTTDKLKQLNRPLDKSAGIQNTMNQLDGKSKIQYTQGNTLNEQGRFPSNVLGEVEGYQKFFYCPKVSRKERHIGFDTSKIPTNPDGMYDTAYNQNDEYAGKDYNAVREQSLKVGNNHPTVKPVELMKYLIKLVTPPNSTVLDPFNGSGSTGMAAVELGHTYIGCELDPAYVEIAKSRIAAWNTADTNNTFGELFETK